MAREWFLIYQIIFVQENVECYGLKFSVVEIFFFWLFFQQDYHNEL